jgi:alpha-D-ribose 1-methylphosphonate 5-triphosphate synthase subunit PhnH
MARPGSIQRLPAADLAAPLPAARFVAALLQTLLDHEVGFAVVAPESTSNAEVVAAYLRETTGSQCVQCDEADYVLVLGPLPPWLPTALKRGTPSYPDESATLICLVPPIDSDTIGALVTLSGPGIPDVRTVRLPGVTPAALTSLTAANADLPMGIDLILVDPDGALLCLPRSTRMSRDS